MDLKESKRKRFNTQAMENVMLHRNPSPYELKNMCLCPNLRQKPTEAIAHT